MCNGIAGIERCISSYFLLRRTCLYDFDEKIQSASLETKRLELQKARANFASFDQSSFPRDE